MLKYDTPMMIIKVANVVIKLDISDKFFREDIFKFRNDEAAVFDVLVEIANEPFPAFPEFGGEAPPVHHVHLLGEEKYYLMSADDYVNFIRYDHTHSRFTINIKEFGIYDEDSVEAVNSALRRTFIMVMAARGVISLHSSTVGFSGGAVCFSASSGTGKTTHTNLWREHIAGACILNGDKCYLLLDEETACFYSAPWCGTSGDCINATAPLKAVVFLEQAKENSIHKLSIPEAFMCLLTGGFLPAWDTGLYLKAIDMVEQLAYAVPCYLLRCRPDEEAMRICYNGIYQ
jgi:hypothetical protein